MYEVNFIDNKAVITNLKNFDLAKCCSCGQSFRWTENNGIWSAVALNRFICAEQVGETLTIYPCNEEDFDLWKKYFDLDRDYDRIENDVRNDKTLAPCVEYANGIRIFSQDPFETLISFIISANNNIKRISSSIDKLSRLAGELMEDNEHYMFPTPDAIVNLTEDEIRSCGVGFRAPYIKESAKMVRDGFDLKKLKDMELDEARKELQKFPGVGPKVADCVLLFSLSHYDAFPMDVWMGRAMRYLYFKDCEPTKKQMNDTIKALGKEAGIIQQYIFHYARENSIKN